MPKSRSARLLDSLWSVTAVALAVFALRSPSGLSGTIYIGLQLLAGILFIVRRDAVSLPATKSEWTLCMSSMLYIYFYDFHRSSSSVLGQCLILFGSIFCFIATLCLGNCFAVLPAYRGVRTAGLYQLMRHPIYSSYLLMDVGIILLYPSRWNDLLFIVAIGLFITRIQHEEAILAKYGNYEEYRRIVPYRLIPLIY